MFFKKQIANFKMDGDLITVSSKDLDLRFNYSSVNSLYINTEIDETAREMEVSMKKLKRTEPELAEFLRMKFGVNDVSFSFVVSRAEGEPLALFVENEFRRIMLSAKAVPGSMADESKKHFADDDPNEAVYPIYFHGCGGFDDDDDDEETEI